MHHSSLERFVRERNQRAGHAGRGCLILGSKLKAALHKTIKRFMLKNLRGEHNGKKCRYWGDILHVESNRGNLWRYILESQGNDRFLHRSTGNKTIKYR